MVRENSILKSKFHGIIKSDDSAFNFVLEHGNSGCGIYDVATETYFHASSLAKELEISDNNSKLLSLLKKNIKFYQQYENEISLKVSKQNSEFLANSDSEVLVIFMLSIYKYDDDTFIYAISKKNHRFRNETQFKIISGTDIQKDSAQSNLESSDISDLHVSINDIIDIEELQKLQDMISEATGVASLITTPDGVPVTNPSNHTRLCSIIKKN
ncbi:MAG: PocR ligand-binding domain-containing protein [Candidatus Kapaibacterium sp.]